MSLAALVERLRLVVCVGTGGVGKTTLDPELSQWLTRPYAAVGRSAFRSAGATLRFILRRLEWATGRQTLGDVSALFTAMDGLLASACASSRCRSAP